MGIETESERGSDEQRITRIGLHVCTAVFSDVIVSSPLHATVLSSPTFIGKSPASIGKPRKRRQDILVRDPVALNGPIINATGVPTSSDTASRVFVQSAWESSYVEVT